MKYKLIIFLLLTSCVNNNYSSKNNFTYYAKGFAKIQSVSPVNLNNNFLASHNNLRVGTKINLFNPANSKSFDVVNKKKN